MVARIVNDDDKDEKEQRMNRKGVEEDRMFLFIFLVASLTIAMCHNNIITWTILILTILMKFMFVIIMTITINIIITI